MNVRLLTLILAVACSMFVGAQDSTPTDAKTKTIVKLLVDWDNAYIKKDATPLERLLSEDYIGIDENGGVTAKADEIAMIKTGEYVLISVDLIEPPRVRFYGSTAVATTLANVKQTFKGETATIKARATTVCVEKEGRWQITSWHASKLKE